MKITDKDAKKYKQYLKELTEAVAWAIYNFDNEMKLPSTNERGSRIARITNALELKNDSAMHFGLDYSFEKINKKYKTKTPPCDGASTT